MILVDTSVWIDFFLKADSLSAVFLDKTLTQNSPVCINGIIEMEILQGIRDENQYLQTKLFLKPFQYYPHMNGQYFEKATDIFRTCRRRGITIRRTLDCLIAANCLIDNLTVAHRDRDFDAMSKVFTELKVIKI